MSTTLTVSFLFSCGASIGASATTMRSIHPSIPRPAHRLEAVGDLRSFVQEKMGAGSGPFDRAASGTLFFK